ncbi:hypothetical protein QQ045_031782 [Rhodiola kirilowii]
MRSVSMRRWVYMLAFSYNILQHNTNFLCLFITIREEVLGEVRLNEITGADALKLKEITGVNLSTGCSQLASKVEISSLESLSTWSVSLHNLKGKAGDWGDGVKSRVHIFNLLFGACGHWAPTKCTQRIGTQFLSFFCRPWGKLPENVPCHPNLADFANCMKKKGRGMSIFVSILDGDYHERAEDAKEATKRCEDGCRGSGEPTTTSCKPSGIFLHGLVG